MIILFSAVVSYQSYLSQLHVKWGMFVFSASGEWELTGPPPHKSPPLCAVLTLQWPRRSLLSLQFVQPNTHHLFPPCNCCLPFVFPWNSNHLQFILERQNVYVLVCVGFVFIWRAAFVPLQPFILSSACNYSFLQIQNGRGKEGLTLQSTI